MSEVIEPEGEELKMGSLYHGLVQGKLIALLSNDERLTVIPELSLDVSQIDLSQFGIKVKNELIPDVCLYKGSPPEPEPLSDVLRVTQMPQLVIEVLSPGQAVSDILAKFKAYFALGIKSCWLVIPWPVNCVMVHSLTHSKTFGTENTEIIDETIDIHLPVKKVFK
jgi:Uma2 family endonuclease